MQLIINNKPKKDQKKCLVIRYGAWGDAVFITPALRQLHKDDYHITLNCTERTYDILKTDKHIDSFLLQETGLVPVEKLDVYWKQISKKFDKVVNFTGSLEQNLIMSPQDKLYYKSKEEIHKVCNILTPVVILDMCRASIKFSNYQEADKDLEDEKFAAKYGYLKQVEWDDYPDSEFLIEELYPYIGCQWNTRVD